MTHSHLLSLLSYTLLSLLGLSRAFPNPIVISGAPVPTSLADTGVFVPDSLDNATNTISATDPVVGGVDLAEFTFDPLQMPTQPGSSETQVIKAFLTGPSAAPNSALTSRSISTYVTAHAFDGSTTTQNGTTVYSIPVNATAMRQMFQDATAYALAQYNTGNILGGESDHNYYRFTSQGLTIAAMAYGEAGSGDTPFNWGDFSILTGFLTNLTIKYPTKNMTWNGYITMSDGSRGVDFFVVPSIGDVQASSTPDPTPPAAAAVANPIGGADGGLRLAKRVFSIKLGIDGIQLTTRKARAQILTGLLYHLASNALTSLEADSGLSPLYTQLVTGTGDTVLDQVFPNAVMQIVANRGLALSKEVLLEVLNFLVDLTSMTSTHTGSSPILYGELKQRGKIVARWSLGQAIAGFPCIVQNPDGSVAVGCFIRQ